MKKIFLLAIILSSFKCLFAYPISPRPLRKLISEAENIIVAYVYKTENVKTDDWNSTRAVLIVKEVLQGNIKSDTIYVYYSPGMICPAPASYEKSKTVIAFINKRKKGLGYTTHALSYGSKTLTKNGIELYKNRIAEMQLILKIKDEKEATKQTVEWLITCASFPETRWEGIYELSPQSDFMSYYDQDKDTFIKKYTLSDNQKEKLREILFSIKQLEYSDIGLIDIVKRETDPELVGFLIKSLKSLNEDNLWYADFLTERIALFTNRKDLVKIIKKMENVDYSDKNYEKKKKELLT